MRELLHISDLHFGPHHLDEVAEGVHGLIRDARPDLVVVSGDLTLRAKPHQFRAARQFVDAIEQKLGIPVLAIPGNHDVPLYRVWERALAPYRAYERDFSANLEPTFEDDEMLVVGVNTAANWTLKDGLVPRRRLKHLADQLATAGSRFTVVTLHHPLVPAPRFDNRRVFRHAVETANLLVEHGVDLVLAGHHHQWFVTRSDAYYPSGRRGVLLAHCGTTTSSRGRGCERGLNTANRIRLEGEVIEIDQLGWDGEQGRFAVWSQQRHPRSRSESLDGAGSRAATMATPSEPNA